MKKERSDSSVDRMWGERYGEGEGVIHTEDPIREQDKTKRIKRMVHSQCS